MEIALISLDQWLALSHLVHAETIRIITFCSNSIFQSCHIVILGQTNYNFLCEFHAYQSPVRLLVFLSELLNGLSVRFPTDPVVFTVAITTIASLIICG